MGYNPNIRLNPDQLGLIETALRSEISRLAWPPADPNSGATKNKDSIRELNELLGHLHHQKVWYTPKKRVPLG